MEQSNNRRIARVRELLKQEISEVIRQEIPIDTAGLLTVNDVGIARDLRSAIVFLGFVGSKLQRRAALEELESKSRLIQSRVGSSVRLKFTPVLRFQIDDSIEKGNRVLSILDEIEQAQRGHQQQQQQQ